jgi:hypothetical protein
LIALEVAVRETEFASISGESRGPDEGESLVAGLQGIGVRPW